MGERFILPAGTLCKRGGIPFKLVHAVQVECHPENWPLIREGFVPSVAATEGQALARSQSLQGLDMPTVAQPCGVSATTSSSSLESSSDFSKSRT